MCNLDKVSRIHRLTITVFLAHSGIEYLFEFFLQTFSLSLRIFGRRSPISRLSRLYVRVVISQQRIATTRRSQFQKIFSRNT